MGLQTKQVTAATALLPSVISRSLYPNPNLFCFHVSCRKETSKPYPCTINCCPLQDLESMKTVALFICLVGPVFAISVSPHHAITTRHLISHSENILCYPIDLYKIFMDMQIFLYLSFSDPSCKPQAQNSQTENSRKGTLLVL